MEHEQSKGRRGTALLIEPEAEQREKLQRELPRWSFLDVSAGRVVSEGQEMDSADVVLVFAKTHQEGHALDVSRQIRRNREYDDVPVLVAITIYQMPLGHDIQKLPKAGFIFRPIKAEELARRVSELKDA
jgi:response regulator RpfG family c-di-GMP phosphodiesterase